MNTINPTHLQMIDYVARLEKKVSEYEDEIKRLLHFIDTIRPVLLANPEYMRNR